MSVTNVVGGVVAFAGLVKAIDVLNSGRAKMIVHLDMQGLPSKAQRVAQAVGIAFQLLGEFLGAAGLIAMGAFMVSALPHVAFFTATQQGIAIALPYLAGGLAAVTTGIILQQLAR